MRVLALRARRFRKFDDAVFTFHPRFNVVVGPNEAGKSTLRHALLAAFFVNPASASRRVEGWRPWTSEQAGSLTVEFELEGTRYECHKDFERRKVELRDLARDHRWEGPKVQKSLEQALGLSTEDLYRATAMVEQAEIASLRGGAEDIGQRLSRVVQAGPGDAEAGAVIKKVEKELGELERGLGKPAKHYGTIRKLEDETDELAGRVDDLREQIARLDQMGAELRKITGACETASQELETKGALLRVNEEFLALEQQLSDRRRHEAGMAERIGAIENGYRRQEAIRAELEALQAQGVPEDTAVDDLRGRKIRVQLQRETVGEREEDAVKAQRKVDNLPSLPRARLSKPLVQGVSWMLVILAVSLAAASSLLQIPSVLTRVAASAATLALALVVLGRLEAKAAATAQREEADAVRALEERIEALSAARESLEKEVSELESALRAIGTASVEEALDRHRRARDLRQEYQAGERTVESLRGTRTLEELRDERARVAADILRHEMALNRPDAQTKRLTALEVQGLQQEVQRLTQQVHRLEARREFLQGEMAQAAPDYEALALAEERLTERCEALEAARRRARVCRAVLDGLREARQQTLIPARRQVEERAGAYLSLLTAGAYSTVKIEEPPLRISVWVPGLERMMEAAEPHLSRGTVDQIYLAVRLALVEVLSEGKRPPLLLDDPFGTFDPVRLEAAMALLRRVSGHHQVLLFTCQPEYESFADRVVHVGEIPPAEVLDVPGPLWQVQPPQTH